MSILEHLDPSHRSDEDIPRFKDRCCMKYTVDKQCNRCPFRQIEDQNKRNIALQQCWDKRRGTYRDGDLEIEYNNQYR